MHGAMREIPPLVIATCVDEDIPKAEGTLGGVRCAGASTHPTHRDGHIAMDFDVLRIDLAQGIASRQRRQPLRLRVNANYTETVRTRCICSSPLSLLAVEEAIFDNGVKVECDESDLGVSLCKRFAILGSGLHLLNDVSEPVRRPSA